MWQAPSPGPVCPVICRQQVSAARDDCRLLDADARLHDAAALRKVRPHCVPEAARDVTHPCMQAGLAPLRNRARSWLSGPAGWCA